MQLVTTYSCELPFKIYAKKMQKNTKLMTMKLIVKRLKCILQS